MVELWKRHEWEDQEWVKLSRKEQNGVSVLAVLGMIPGKIHSREPRTSPQTPGLRAGTGKD